MAFPFAFEKTIKIKTQQLGISSDKYILQKIRQKIDTKRFKYIEQTDCLILKQKQFYYPDKFIIDIQIDNENVLIKQKSYTIYGFIITLFTLLFIWISNFSNVFIAIGTIWILYMVYGDIYLAHKRLFKLIIEILNTELQNREQ
ncbi:hypothetical protein ACE1ET_20235 [Saccharicrinis sp. FJH62]|uniref:hypothetical protein n=1 Tax=Saccharicrinis sp. FJH62 TaxID=3344657 RepID=UPI0035D442F3